MAFEPCCKNYFIEQIKRVLPASFWENMFDGVGSDPFFALAKLAQDLEERINTTQQAYFLKEHTIQTGPNAQGAIKANAEITIRRTAASGPVRIPAGTIIEAYNTNSIGSETYLGNYVLTHSVDFTSGEYNKNVIAAAEFAGYSYNTSELVKLRFEQYTPIRLNVGLLDIVFPVSVLQITSEDGEFLQIYDKRPFRFLETANLDDPTKNSLKSFVYDSPGAAFFLDTLDVSNADKTTIVEILSYNDAGLTIDDATFSGGIDGVIDTIAKERGTVRSLNETDSELRDRITNIFQTVTLSAVTEICDTVLTPLGLEFYIREPFDTQFTGFIADIHPLDFGSVFDISKTTGSKYIGQRGLLLPIIQRYFIIVIKNNSALTMAQVESRAAQLWSRVNDAKTVGVNFDIYLQE